MILVMVEYKFERENDQSTMSITAVPENNMKLLARFSLAFLLSIACLLAFGLFQVLIHYTDYLWAFATVTCLVLAPLVYLCLVLFALALGTDMRMKLTMASISGLMTLYIAELLLIIAGPYVTLTRDFDRRSKLEVVQDLRRAGQNAYPSIHPKNIMPSSLSTPGGELIPLGGIPHATTVFCNETGKYYIYESDEFGFTNPPQLYTQELDLALIGDSFTQGFCAPFGQSYAEQIRRSVPRTINLGNNGNGPLLELAGVREFLTKLKPRYVFWIYFEGNDMEDLSREIAHPLLKNYLKDPNFSQNLMTRVADYDIALREFVENGIALESSRNFSERFLANFKEQFRLWSRLWHIRALLGLTDLKRDWPPRNWNPQVSEQEAEAVMGQILKQAKRSIESWGGELVVVYLPSYRTFGYQITHPWRGRVLDLLESHGISYIDVLTLFSQHPDAISLFNFRKEAHYTAEGNQIVMQALVRYLASENVPNLLKPITMAADHSSLQNYGH